MRHRELSDTIDLMTVLPIVTGEDSDILHTKTQKIAGVNKEVQTLIKNMKETMQKAEGLGIAAPQVGSTQRVCIARIGKRVTALINPAITWKSEETGVHEEGCLSLPGVWLRITRPTDIVVTYQDETGATQERKLSGMDARVVQHEIDHLDGVLITDYMEASTTNLNNQEHESAL